MKIYLLILVLAAGITYLMVPPVRRLAVKMNAITPIRERDVHTQPTPRMGGLAIYIGLAVSLLVASRIPYLHGLFAMGSNAPWAFLSGGGVIVILGVADDLWELDWLAQLSGQILAAGLMALQGVQLYTFPIAGLTVGSGRLSLIVTIAFIVITMNAVNFVDGLDGLAAGLSAIGAGAFFVYTYLLADNIGQASYASLASLILVITVGVSLGFLPHNYHPAHIFLGGSGPTLLGILLSGSAILVTGQIDPDSVTRHQAFPAFMPIFVPLAIIAVPLLDFLWSVIRRAREGHSPFYGDGKHLHHRLVALGHSHRRAVLIMYMWASVFAFGIALLSIFSTRTVAIGMVVGVLIALGATIPLSKRRFPSMRRKKR